MSQPMKPAKLSNEIVQMLIERIIKEETNKKSLKEKISKKDMKFGNDNPLLPGDLKKGQNYLSKDGKILTFTGQTLLDDFKVHYNFKFQGRGNYAMTHDEVLDNVTYLNEMLMRKKTELKLRKLIERIIKEESGIVGDMDKSFFKTQKKIGTAKMKNSTKLKLENLIRKLIREETSNSGKILTLVKQLKKIDSQKRDPLNDPDTPEGERIIAQLQSLGVMNADGHFIHGHPLMDKIDAIWG